MARAGARGAVWPGWRLRPHRRASHRGRLGGAASAVLDPVRGHAGATTTPDPRRPTPSTQRVRGPGGRHVQGPQGNLVGARRGRVPRGVRPLRRVCDPRRAQLRRGAHLGGARPGRANRQREGRKSSCRGDRPWCSGQAAPGPPARTGPDAARPDQGRQHAQRDRAHGVGRGTAAHGDQKRGRTACRRRQGHGRAHQSCGPHHRGRAATQLDRHGRGQRLR